ncbi:hypothetical protein HYV83_03695 [Candidatus Woesearchaeota archaeon]|nr:hypothetical protein [Candidatus Woesearchaeota archaeon]
MKASKTSKAKTEEETQIGASPIQHRRQPMRIDPRSIAHSAIGGIAPQWPELCLRCGHKMVETHCKAFCPSCGYMRDCNDQW